MRVLFDSASQRSYILKKTAQELGLISKGSVALCHILFGGLQEKTEHIKYRVEIGHPSNGFFQDIEVLDKDKICETIPRLEKGSWMGELKKKHIFLSDLGVDWPDIELLIGADFYGELLTGRICALKSGLVAIETRLGWTVMGQNAGASKKES
jgi:hypothetical protein